jgi:hypothetical protein
MLGVVFVRFRAFGVLEVVFVDLRVVEVEGVEFGVSVRRFAVLAQ